MKRILFVALAMMCAVEVWAGLNVGDGKKNASTPSSTARSAGQNSELDRKISVLKSDDFSESLDWLNQLEKELKSHYKEDDFLFTIIYHRKANIYSSEYQYDKSIAERKKIVDILEKKADQDKNIADVLRSIGLEYSAAGNYAESIEFHKKALELYKRLFGDYHIDTASEYNNLASEYSELDKFDEAEKCYERLLDIIQKIDGANSVDVAVTLGNVGVLFNKKGDYAKAIEYWSAALTLLEKSAPNSSFVANCYESLATNYSCVGDYDKATAYSLKALDLAEKSYGADNPETRHFYLSHACNIFEDARINANASELNKALAYYSKALAISLKYKFYDDTFRITCQEYAALLMEFGPGGWAEELALRDISSAEYKKIVDGLVKVINDSLPAEQAKFFYPEYNGAKKINDGARLFYNFALYIRQNVGGVKEDNVIAEIYHCIAVSYARDGDTAKAREFNKKSLEIKKKLFGEFHPECAGIYYDEGYEAYNSGNKKAAVVEWKKVLKSYENSQNHSLTIDRAKDFLFYDCGDKSFTGQTITAALASAEKSRLDSDANKSFIMKKVLPVYYYAVKFSVEQKSAPKVFEYSEQMRSRAFLDQMGIEEALKLKGISDSQKENVRLLLGEINSAKRDLEKQNSIPLADRDARVSAEAARKLSESEKKLSELENEISKKIPKYAQLRNPQVVSAAQAQAWCSSNRAIVEYVLWSDDYSGAGNEKSAKDSYCIILSKTGVKALKLDSAFDYSSCVNALREKIISCADEKTFEKERNELYARICEPIVSNLPKGINELLIVPDGNLAFLPFDILRKSPSGKDFGEFYSIELSPSVSISYLIDKTSKKMGKALAFGGAWYDNRLSEAQHRKMFENAASSVKNNSRKIQMVNIGTENLSASKKDYVESVIAKIGIGGYLASLGANWSNLPGTLQEVQMIKTNVFEDNSIVLRTQDQVTESDVKKLSDSGQLSKYPILHFACHGYFDEYVPEVCSLVFSEVCGKLSKYSSEDGYLTVPEVSVLDLDSDMVCLSACDTGLGEVRSGDGIVGLSRGFMVAGAKNVGVSLWEVDDEATSDFMVRMYKKRKEGLEYADAYRAVKEDFRKDGRWSHPFYWAAFTLYGGGLKSGSMMASSALSNNPKFKKAEENLKLGKAAEEKKDYAKALSCYAFAADVGLPEAQYCLGVLYDYGRGTSKNHELANSWYEKACEQGHIRAAVDLGYNYRNGIGIEKDYDKANELFLSAANQAGDSEAQFYMGVAYDFGYGVQKDDVKACEWYKKSADQDNKYALYNLAKNYEKGLGVSQDYAQALALYERAAAQNYSDAQCSIGYFFDKGYGVEQSDAKAFDWYERAARNGNKVAQFNLGVMYETGRGCAKSISDARNWYKKSADQGYESAKKALARLDGVSASAGGRWLFPLYGCELGKTTVEELARKGKKDPKYKCYEINGQNFWFFGGKVFDSMYITKYGWIPEWKQIGYNPELSYEGWISFLKSVGYTVTIQEAPSVQKGSFAAKISASKSTPIKHELRLNFNYSNKTKTSDSGTLYSLNVDLR
ncbi:MAG: CHAT domain-containing protein [Treponema sp.]|nr:CHAT domain-containing protein [Treponema sp.]